MEALAVAAGLPIAGGGVNEAVGGHGINEQSRLAKSIHVGFNRRPADGYFFRAELQANFATLLEQRQLDPDFNGDPYSRYGGKSLHTRSHGEAFLSVMQSRFSEGLFLLDEPESALSPKRQLTLLALIYRLASIGKSQFFIATHSPILLTFPNATIISFDEGAELPQIELQDTSHFQVTRDVLSHPESYWKHLRGAASED